MANRFRRPEIDLVIKCDECGKEAKRTYRAHASIVKLKGETNEWIFDNNHMKNLCPDCVKKLGVPYKTGKMGGSEV